MTADSGFEERKRKALERWKRERDERDRMKVAGKETAETLKNIAFQRTKEMFGLPEEWNEVQCLVSLSKDDAAAFTDNLLDQVEIVSTQFARERQRRQQPFRHFPT